MLKLALAIAAVAFAAFALWRQTAKASPRPYSKLHLINDQESGLGRLKVEDAVRNPFASTYRRKHLLTPLQLVCGLVGCAALLVALVIAAILFTHQHFHIKERLGLERPMPTQSAGPLAP